MPMHDDQWSVHFLSTLTVWRCSLSPATERTSHAPHPTPSQWPCHRRRRSCSSLQRAAYQCEVRNESNCRPCPQGEGPYSRHHNWCMSWRCLVHSTRRRIAQGSGQQHRPGVDERAYAPTYRAPVPAWILHEIFPVLKNARVSNDGLRVQLITHDDFRMDVAVSFETQTHGLVTLIGASVDDDLMNRARCNMQFRMTNDGPAFVMTNYGDSDDTHMYCITMVHPAASAKKSPRNCGNAQSVGRIFASL